MVVLGSLPWHFCPGAAFAVAYTPTGPGLAWVGGFCRYLRGVLVRERAVAVGLFRCGRCWALGTCGRIVSGGPLDLVLFFQSFKNKTIHSSLPRLGLSSVYRIFVYLRSKNSTS